MKRTFMLTLILSIVAIGFTQSGYALFRGIVDTAETAVGGAVDVAEDAVGVAGDTAAAAVGVGRYDRDGEYNRIRDRRVDYNQRREQLNRDYSNNY